MYHSLRTESNGSISQTVKLMIRKIMDPVMILLRSAAKFEEESLNTYQIYAEITDHFGLKRLLSALEEDIKIHVKRLSSLLEDPRLPERFDPQKVSLLPDSFAEVEYAFDANMEYRDFLRMILRREEAIAERYEALQSVASDVDLQLQFKRMSEDCQKHVWLAQDRYDLETLI